MDFHHFEIPSSVLRRAKEIVAKKEEPWKSWSAILRNQPGVLAVNRAAIFNLIRIAPENIHHTPAAHLEFINKTMTAEFISAVELLPLPTPSVETEAPAEQLRVENLGGGVFSTDGLIGGNTDPVINTSSNEVEKRKTQRRPPAMCRWKRLSQRKTKMLVQYHRAKALMQLIRIQIP